jgi:galactokinase
MFSISEIKPNPAASWANYVKGVLVQLKKRGVNFTGFNAAIHSTLPMGAGMSSSAALEVATAMTVRRLSPFHSPTLDSAHRPRLTPKARCRNVNTAERMNFAKLCRAAENEFVGVPCGILDQTSSLFGKPAHVMEIDCATLTVGHAPLFGHRDGGLQLDGETRTRRRRIQGTAG